MRALVLAAFLFALAFARQAGAQAPPPEAMAPPGEARRVDLYDARSRRTGYGKVEPGLQPGGRLDFYDARSRRVGYGKVEEGSRLELFGHKSRRVGVGVPAK